MSDPLPVLYTFRRCPYAMRARWALRVAGVAVELREIVLKAKPAAMLAASPKGTVPVLVLPGGGVVDESLLIMEWALAQHDPHQWLQPERASLNDMRVLIERCEQAFKPHLDRYKYPNRYLTAPADRAAERRFSDQHFEHAVQFLETLSAPLANAACLFGDRPALADFAIVPFVRQFARADQARFAAHAAPALDAWMQRLLARPDFASVMARLPVWREGVDGALPDTARGWGDAG